jgi:GNAT superfamily N-acetyltransferase
VGGDNQGDELGRRGVIFNRIEEVGRREADGYVRVDCNPGFIRIVTCKPRQPSCQLMGAARTILSLLADWAAARAAAHMYLQVEIDNAPALQLYNTSKFTDLHRYHYRQRVSP